MFCGTPAGATFSGEEMKMPQTLYSQRLNALKRAVEQTPEQLKRLALLHKIISMNRCSRLVIQWVSARADELRAELQPNSTNEAQLDALQIRIDQAKKRHDRRVEKRAAERLAAEAEAKKSKSAPVEEAPPTGESTADRIRRLMAEQQQQKEKVDVPRN